MMLSNPTGCEGGFAIAILQAPLVGQTIPHHLKNVSIRMGKNSMMNTDLPVSRFCIHWQWIGKVR